MNKWILGLLCLLSITILFPACQKKGWDEYYKPPANLASPIYQQLQAQGNFKHFLEVVDKSGYKEILGKAGAWTLFAPTDDAFEKYFQENGITSVEAIDAATARKIALYGLVYNPYRKEQLASSQTTSGLVPNVSFRRQTAYYDFVFNEGSRKVFNNGLNGLTYIPTVDNNKYIPYFVDEYTTATGFSNTDFQAFYPGKTYSGFNVAGAEVVKANIPAENGIIHAVDKVLLPLPSIDQYLASQPKYSKFKSLIDRFAVYVASPVLTERHRVLTGLTDSVYVKSYTTALAFSPNNENYLAVSTDGQTQEWSIAVPTDDVLNPYISKLLKYYGNFDNAPTSILANLINSHMWRNVVWPSDVTTEVNVAQEPMTFAKSNVIESKQLSNGNFYGVNKPHEANVFRTIYAGSFLNPAYTLQTRALAGSDASLSVISPNVQQTMFLVSDAAWNSAGYAFEADLNAWSYTAPGASPDRTTVALNRVNRSVTSLVVSTPNDEFKDYANPNKEIVVEAFNKEYIKYKGGKLYGSGNIEDNPNSFAQINTTEPSEDFVNGRTFKVTSGFVKFATDNFNLGAALQRLANSTDVNIKNRYSLFFSYLSGSSLWTAAGTLIQDVENGAFYTLLVPTNAAIQQAITEGKLPAATASASQTTAQRTAVENFLRYHIINKLTVAVDGKKPGKYATLAKNSVGDSRLITVQYPTTNNPDPSTMQILDDASTPTVARPDVATSNNLANRALIHSIDKVLKF